MNVKRYAVIVGLVLAGAVSVQAEEAFVMPQPKGLPPVPVPADNPMTAKKVELGKLLYFDKRLSKDKTISCATCHDPKMGWAEHRATSEGIHGKIGERNSPTIINSAYASTQFWDGRAATLEEQALGPIENPIEMGHEMVNVVKELSSNARYKQLFKEVFGTEVNKEGVAKAIAAFERTIVSGNSRYDKFMAGDKSALNEQEQRGLAIFTGRGLCQTCHTPPVFSNFTFINAGVGNGKDVGRMKVTNNEQDRGAFKVPRLRDIADTAPYFHDGSAATLEDAVALMAGGGVQNPNLNPIFTAVKAANLTAQDKADLVAFLKSLSGDYPRTEPPVLP